VRQSDPETRSAAAGRPAPRGVILIQGDTLRTDHLDAYGYARKTAPTLTRLAKEGALFRSAIAQASWTKASVSSLMTSLYPSAHGVKDVLGRLPASATTLAEVFRQAGYATVSFASVPFTGQFTNLHQGFEELHEDASLPPGPRRTKSAREYVDRAIAWLEQHRDVPFFMYLHFFDPHSPYEPFPPYNTMWADPAKRDEHLRNEEAVKKVIGDPAMAGRAMATRDEVVDAGVDPEVWLRYVRDWYDGSIRGMDAEIARFVERLNALALLDRTGIVFYGDHGEEFHDHGRMWHGDTVYGEMIRVPLIVRWPGAPSGVEVDETVQLIDIFPTVLEMSGVALPKGIQGQSMASLLIPEVRAGGGSAAGWRKRPAVSEKSPQPGSDTPPRSDESYAIVDGNWKLIHHVARPEARPEFELFDFVKDPRDQQNVAAQHPDEVKRLMTLLERWRRNTAAAKLKSDKDATSNLSPAEIQRLRSLGYIK
jgi:arylsulfatase A-like enzyme